MIPAELGGDVRIEAHACDVEEDVPGNLPHVDAPLGDAERVAQRPAGLAGNAEGAGEPVAGSRRHDRQGDIAEREHAADLIDRAIAAPRVHEIRAPRRGIGREDAGMPRALGEPHIGLDASSREHRAGLRCAPRPLVGTTEEPGNRVDDDADAHLRVSLPGAAACGA